MTRKIPDLFDDYLDTTVSLPDADFPAAQRTKELTMKKIRKNRRISTRLPRTALIAAVMVSLLTISVAAVGFTLWDRARNDLGLTDTDIPEYTEYHPETSEEMTFSDEVMEQYAVANAHIDLVSALCTGNKITAYLAISPVPQDMAEATWDKTQGLNDFAYWSYGFSAAVGTETARRSAAMGSTQVDYDAETQTALIRLDMEGEVFGEATGVTLSLTWTQETEQTVTFKYYGDVQIPITQSDSLYTAPNVSIENTFLPGITGRITSVQVRAGYVTATIEMPSFYEACYFLGDDAHYTIGDAYWNYYNAQNGLDPDSDFTELDAYVAYQRAWTSSLAEFTKDMTLQLHDGSSIVITEQDSMYAGWYTPITDSDDDDDFMSETTMAHNFDLSTPLDLSQIESITIGGVTYPLEAR